MLSLAGGGVVVVGGDHLQAGRAGRLLVDEEDGARRAAGVAHLAAGVYRRGSAGGNGAGGKDDDGVGSAGRVDVSRVAAEAEAGVDGRDSAERGARWHKVDIDGARTRGLIEEAQRHQARWRGEGLVLQHRHLQVCGDVAGQQGVLAAGQKIAANRGKLLLRSRGAGRIAIRARGDGNVGADRAEADVVEAGWGALGGARVDVQRGRVGRYVDDANLRERLDARDALATCEAYGQDRECRESTGPLDELGDGESHGCALRTTKIIKLIVNAGWLIGGGLCALRVGLWLREVYPLPLGEKSLKYSIYIC